MKLVQFLKLQSAIGVLIWFFTVLPAMANSSKIDVLVLVSRDAVFGAGSFDKVKTDILADFAYANKVFKNSNVQIDISAAGILEMPMDESIYRNMSDVLDDLSYNGVGQIGFTAAIYAEHFGADIVFLVVEGIEENGQALEICGNSFPCDASFVNKAFAVGQRGMMMAFPSLLVHEVGHLMGVAHDRTRDCGTPDITCTLASFDYSYAHIDPDSVRPQWGTIMAGGRPFGLVDYFSSPQINHPTQGVPLGVENFSDAVRSLNNVRGVFSNFRSPSPNRNGP